MISGATTFGIVRKRMADLLNDFAVRIKEKPDGTPGGAFGVSTTLDTPDIYPGDPLVQIATTASASDAELWAVTELYYAQLNYRSATGRYMELLYGIPWFGIPKLPSETWDQYESKIKSLIQNGAGRTDPDVVAMGFPGVECAKQLFSTTVNPITGIPAPGSMLVIKTCDPAFDYAGLAAELWEKTEIGLYSYYGDVTAQVLTGNDGCIEYAFQPACRIFVSLEIEGYFVDECLNLSSGSQDTIIEIVDQLKVIYAQCGFGQKLTSTELVQLLDVPGFVVTGINMARRAKQLYFDGCPMDSAALVEVCGEIEQWSTYTACGPYCRGESWCELHVPCQQLNAWEFPDFDVQFASLAVVDQEQC